MIPSLRELTLGIMDALHGLFWVPRSLFSNHSSGLWLAFQQAIYQSISGSAVALPLPLQETNLNLLQE